MPNETACAICHGPLLGRYPRIVAGKPAYLCARCFSAAASPPVGRKVLPTGTAPMPSVAPASAGPAHAGLCVGPRGIEQFLNDLIAAAGPGSRIEALAQVMVGVHKQEQSAPGNNSPEGEHSTLPVLLVTAVVRSGTWIDRLEATPAATEPEAAEGEAQ